MLALSLPVAFAAEAEGAAAPDEEAEYGADGHVVWSLGLTWGWRLLRADLAGENVRITHSRVTLFGRTLAPRKRAKRKRVGKAGAARKARRANQRTKNAQGRKRFPFRLADWRSYRDEAVWLLRRALRALRLKGAGNLVYGFDDPALTGLAAGLLGTIGLPPELRTAPDFCASGVRGWTAVRGRTYGLQLLALAVNLFFRPAARRIWMPRLKRSILPRKANQGGQAA